MLNEGAVGQLRLALRSRQYVSGLTHSFYRYPARFSPLFARTAIALFSKPGDTVLDPFVGGGTTVVETLAAGRRAVGVDLNSLAVFVTRAKTTVLSPGEVSSIRNWLNRFLVEPASAGDVHGELLLQSKHVPPELVAVVSMAIRLSSPLPARAQAFARAVLLSACQWSFDGREEVPSATKFRKAVESRTLAMLRNLECFGEALREIGVSAPSSWRHLISGDVASVGPSDMPSGWKRPRLVVTSPPYMGIHILYNRWQVQGRRETPFAYAVAGTPDGYFASHYTFGDRQRHPKVYMERLVAAYKAIRRVVARNGRVVQLVSFARPSSQLPAFLAAMEEAGFEEQLPPGRRRIWRAVPNRKWYVRTREAPSSREVLLLHVPA